MSADTPSDAEELRARLLAGDRRALARAITLAESSLPEDRARLRRALAPAPGEVAQRPEALRVGFTGPPGAGKSTLIEQLGSRLLEEQRRFAVLALDPSSPRSGGSLLGDRTRMPELSASELVFIRPSPVRGALGGVAHATFEALELCELAGFDPLLVETVGVGQSELDVHALVDVLVLVLGPDAGDELQGMKRGITEAADLVVVNQTDRAPERAARTRDAYVQALALLRETPPEVLLVSAATGAGVDLAWSSILELRANAAASGELAARRERRRHAELRRGLERRFTESLGTAPNQERLAALRLGLDAGELSVSEAIERAWHELER